MKEILFSGSAERIITSPITITTKIENKVAAKTIFLLLKPKTNYNLFFLLKKHLRIGYYSSNNMNILQVNNNKICNKHVFMIQFKKSYNLRNIKFTMI